MTNIYYDADADLNILKQRSIAFIGYGNQGRSQALNLRDSGISKIIIGNIEDDYAGQAREDGFNVTSISNAALEGDILFMLIPDEYAPKIFKEEIDPCLKEGDILNFSSGYNITFKKINPPDIVDIIMVAPRMVGKGVREMYKSGEGYPSFVSWHQDYSGKAKKYTLAIAKGVGSTKKGAIEVTFNDETYLDLLSEQGTWPLVMAVFEEVFKFEIEMGHSEEAVLMELYMSKEPVFIFEKMVETGIFSQLKLHSHTSQYGQLSSIADVERHFIRNFIREKYRKIKSGEFDREWEVEKNSGLKELERLFSKAIDSEFGKAESRTKQRLSKKDYSTYEDMVKKITEEVLEKLRNNPI